MQAPSIGLLVDPFCEILQKVLEREKGGGGVTVLMVRGSLLHQLVKDPHAWLGLESSPCQLASLLPLEASWPEAEVQHQGVKGQSRRLSGKRR